jgi:PAS domain S-box-containing protein
MAFVSNPGFLAAAFIDCSAAFVLLILYVLLAQGFPARFFRYWLAGWTLYVFVSALEISRLWNGGPDAPLFRWGMSLATAAVFAVAIVECCGEGRWLKYAWPLVLLVPMILFVVTRKSSQAGLWYESALESSLYVGAGLLLWRKRARHRGHGWKLLAGSLLVRGLHGIDRADWSTQPFALFRVSAHDILSITMGVAMAVLILEAGRARIEELNEKMRRLALITAEATQSLRVHEALAGILHNILPTLSATHGALFLLEREGNPASFALRASTGFGEKFLTQYAQVFVSEPWVRDALAESARVVCHGVPGETKSPPWLDKERLSSAVLVPITGKNKSLGLLCVGSSSPRSFESNEVDFLVNVANLLGLAVQNVSLIEAAATARRQWLDTFNSIDDLIFVHSAEGRILRANRALAWHLGLEPDFVEGQPLRDLLKPGEIRWAVCPYCEGAAGKPEQVDPSFGGHFLVTTSGFHDSDGNRLGTAHVLKDFTERRQAESKFRTLFEKVQEGVFIATPEGRFLDFNDAFMRMLGFEKREDLLRANVPSEIYLDSEERRHLQRLLQDYGEVTDFEFRFQRRDGETRTARESSFVTRDDAGAIVAYQGFMLDVTDQKQAEMEIRRRNRELLALNAIAEVLAASPKLEESLTQALEKVVELFSANVASVYVLDEGAGTLKLVANYGHRSDYGRRMGRVHISNSLLQQVRQARATMVSGAALALPDEFRELQRAEGLVVSQVALLWVKNRITGALSVGCRETKEFSTAELNLLGAIGNQIAMTIEKSRLLEETREAYESLRETQEQLLQSEKMAAVGQLISGVAHELNNPLTAILGYSQLLKNEQGIAGRSADYLEKLHKQAYRTHHIVENLLSFSRQHKPERGPVQINRAIEETLALREYDLKVNQVRVHLQLDPDLPETSGDFHQLQQVFLNILNNAVDAVMEGENDGEIWVRTTRADGKVVIEFRDNGPGVKDPHRVFDPFYTTKPVGKGTGLGLSICYGIVKEHSGEIGVHDAPGGGATFTVTLPLVPYHAETVDASSASRLANSKTVLLLDPDDSVLHLEQEVLLSQGVTIKTARTGQEAINILRRESIEAAVLELATPGEVSVTDLCSWIEQNRPELSKHIVFTSWNGDDRVANPRIGGFERRVILKPFEPGSFWRQAREVLSPETAGTLKR